MTKEQEGELSRQMYIILSYAADEALELLKKDEVKEAQMTLEKGMDMAEELCVSSLWKDYKNW